MEKNLTEELLNCGFVVSQRLINDSDCRRLRDDFDRLEQYRSTIDMQRYNFGRGTYRYFKYPLPPLVQALREDLYEKLVPTARIWAERTHFEFSYPDTFTQFEQLMRERGLTRPTPLILKYGPGDYNCLHQDIVGDLFFPYQMVFGLSAAGVDYQGGHLILTQQRPRMQTVPHVLTIPQGAAVIFASNYHPKLGARGYYRTVFKHGVSKVESGERYTFGLVFHDYAQG